MISIKVAYYVPDSWDWVNYRPGEPAEIIGVRIIKPDRDLEPRPCFEVRYADGTIDFKVIGEPGYRIVDSASIEQEPAHGHDRR